MAPRSYRQSGRAATARATRQRIVEATFHLHGEKGIAATTFRDIASRADVGIGTVYHHFPTYDDVITACGAYTWEMLQPPVPEDFASIADPVERVRSVVAAVYGVYQRFPTMAAARAERKSFAALDAGFRQEEETRRAIIDVAFRGLRASAKTRALAFALLDVTTRENLLASGLTHDAAVAEVSDVLLTRLRLKGKPG